MTDTQRALLGDREAAKRVTEAGELLPCPRCGKIGVVYKYPGEDWKEPYTAKCQENDCFWIGKDYPTRRQAIREWNTRAPLLTPTQLALLEISREPRKMEVDINVDDV